MMMRRCSYRLPVAGLATIMSASLAGSLRAQQQEPPALRRLVVRVENPIALLRQDETVAVPWGAVVRQLAGARPDRVRVLDAVGREVTSQVVDNDGDTRPDELLFQSDFSPAEVKAFAIEATVPTVKPTPRVYVRHDEPRDDIAWESDRIAFRIYGEGLKRTSSAMSSSGIDVWPKRVRALVVEKWYAKGHDAYHVDTGEGADFFDVGETLGAGGTAVWQGDTIYRADNFKSYRVLANGPIRAIVELRYDPWNAAGLFVSEIKRIAIDAGQNLYRQESVFRADGVSQVPYVIGVVKRPGMVATMSKSQPWAWLTGWGPVAPKNGGHGELGTAVLLARERVIDWKEVHNHYLALSRATPGQPAMHYVGAGWTASGDFPTPQAWWGHLDRFARRLAAPIKVTIGAGAITGAGATGAR
jgi:pectinesterase